MGQGNEEDRIEVMERKRRRERTFTANFYSFLSRSALLKKEGGYTDAKLSKKIGFSKSVVGRIHGGDRAHSEKVVAVTEKYKLLKIKNR